MRVLHFFKTYMPDSFTGIERVIWQIAEGTVAHGVQSEVLSLSRHPKENSVRIDNHMAHKARLDLDVASTGLSLSAINRFVELARDADIIHYHFPWPYMDLVHFLGQVRKPTIVTYHSDIVRQKNLMRLYRPLMHAFLTSVDRIVATSPNYLESSPVLRQFRDKTVVIPIGLADQATPPEDGAVSAWRAQVGEGFFLFVGALRYYKGLQFLIDAARHTGLPVVIVGQGEMEAEIRAAGLPNVHLVGAVGDQDKAALMQLARAFVFPSHLRSEAFGVALLEAAMAGKPMISCEIGTGTSYVNIDGETGLTVPPEDAVALAAAMRTIAGDAGRSAAMGRNARSRYLALMTADTMAASYAALYRELLVNRRGIRALTHI